MSGCDFDIAIIGSGFGGSVCAARAAHSGLRTVVLERGPRLDAADFEDMAAGKRPFIHRRGTHGILQLHAGRGLGALTANAVGGGSRIYTAATLPARPEIFEAHWPGITRPMLDPYYARAAGVILPTPTPVELERTRVLRQIGNQLRSDMTALPLAMDWPEDGGELAHVASTGGVRRETAAWLQGGHACRKRSLDKTYLCLAESSGAQVRPLHEVCAIVPSSNGFRVYFRHWHEDHFAEESLSALRVVLAAGALNSIRLLFHCRDVAKSLPAVSPALGRRFFTNGDLGAMIVGSSATPSRDSGPPTTAWIDLWESDRLYLMEMGAWPMPLALESISSRWGRAWAFAAMGFDDAPAALNIGAAGKLQMRREKKQSAAFDKRRIDRLRELAVAMGGRLIATPAWCERRMPTTVHPMGGAVMANSPDLGVTDRFGEVFGHPGLYIADSSVFPTPTGNAPSLTIAAVAEYIIERLIGTW